MDGTRREGTLATLYQRGVTLEQAQINKEWMYVNIMSKNDIIKSLSDLTKIQNDDIIKNFPDARITYLSTIKRDDNKVMIREIDVSSYPTKEYTGFVEFDDFIFFSVLFTPEETKKKNIRKLESILQQVVPLSICHNDSIE